MKIHTNQKDIKTKYFHKKTDFYHKKGTKDNLFTIKYLNF
ncbi:hypothetical protein FLJC2902T_14130 [Flavobacterium limnosediminis JC2902]|uniref:Uncharacterized protein n=1 Tax=Flavobacterium limnosediminis JC2902 TaxID=1341181 RepID=V6SQB2_9FLAO|nr:hypothetical protein FLJC2902T_14130 [Flavobacterium limnosediminis JC2902]